jgi:starch synthase
VRKKKQKLSPARKTKERITGKNPSGTFNNVWLITREYDGLAGAGGVKDVSRQLAEALAKSTKKVRAVLPCYGFMNPEDLGFKQAGISFTVAMPYVGIERREQVEIWQRREKNITIYLADTLRFREKRSVYTYTAADETNNPEYLQGTGHHDYFAMNVLLQKAAIALIMRLREQPDIIHCQDGHTAILPAIIRETEGYRHYFNRTGCVVTIHNAGRAYHQEVADLSFAETICGLPERIINENLLEGLFDPFLAASSYAILNTVSENYAGELRETDADEQTGWLGHRLLARGVRLEGVTNGINADDYDPQYPEKLGLPFAFSPEKGELAGKKKGREDLLAAIAENSLSGVMQDGTLSVRSGIPLFTFIGRFSHQKGVDVMTAALERLLAGDKDFQALILGSGTREIEDNLLRLTHQQGRVCVLRGYDPVLANRIYAAGDFFLVPSRYEPCGLTDYIAQLFGNIPIVHHIGGLVKVVDDVTGFAYREESVDALQAAMQKAIWMFHESPEKIKEMQRAAVRHIRKNYTWDKVVKKYYTLYQEALAQLQ